MIPDFNHSHVLPPFLGGDPTVSARGSPYAVSMLELVQRFASSAIRRRLLDGLVRYRADLAQLGFVRGFQWVDGSFSEDIETQQQRSPNDIDLVTFAYAPAGLSNVEVAQLLDANAGLFVAAKTKNKYGCDAYIVPLGKSAENLVKRTAYYFSLFSHRRGDHVWKGLIQIPLESDDALARALLNNAPSGENDAATA
jgi:hypothetical protein